MEHTFIPKTARNANTAQTEAQHIEAKNDTNTKRGKNDT